MPKFDVDRDPLTRKQLVTIYLELVKVENGEDCCNHRFHRGEPYGEAAYFMGWAEDRLSRGNYAYFDDFRMPESLVFHSQIAMVLAFTLALHEFEPTDEEIAEAVAERMIR